MTKLEKVNKILYNQTYLKKIKVQDKILVDKILQKYFSKYMVEIKTQFNFSDNLSREEFEDIFDEINIYEKVFNWFNPKIEFAIVLLMSLFSLYFLGYQNVFNIDESPLMIIKLLAPTLLLATFFIRWIFSFIRNKFKSKRYFFQIVNSSRFFKQIKLDSEFTESEINYIQELRKESMDYREKYLMISKSLRRKNIKNIDHDTNL